MENKENKPLDSQSIVKIRFSPEEEKDCFIGLRSQLIKLLYMVEAERNEGRDASLWFFNFMLDLSSANSLCNNKLTRVVIKIHSLFENNSYKTMDFAQIKRQVFESKGILDHLIGDKKTKK